MATGSRRGILGWGTYLPYRRLDRSAVAPVAGLGGGQGTRTVASFDEDTTTMGVEAARAARRMTPVAPDTLWFSTVAPAYLDRTNATAIAAALGLEDAVGAYDAVGSVRSGLGALRAALAGSGTGLVVTSDLRTGRPGSPDEVGGGDGAAALVVGGPEHGPVLAEVLGQASVTREFVDRWRVPGENASRQWEERFGEAQYVPAGLAALEAALKDAGLAAGDVDRLVVTGTHERAAASVARRLGVGPAEGLADSLSATVGNTGAAHPSLLLASVLERAAPGEIVGLVVLADGAEALVLRTSDGLPDARPQPEVASQVAGGGPVSYGRYLAWRGWLPVEPPRRPAPARPSASAAARSTDWKFGFVGSTDEQGKIHLPPSPLDDQPRRMAEAAGTIVTFTVDRLAYSPSPPVVFAVVDFDDGGRVPLELTDVDVDEVTIGARVRMTFRRLFVADGLANYFWKATLVREGEG